ncbi:MAG: agmatinase family protein [Candidatus Diapherotrites archaeon]|nr:agmatinase family protein [Candidatus Diapherotrites archaeon]
MFDYWKLPPYNFAGLESHCDFESSRFVVVPVPFDSTVSYGSGCREGPHAVISASRHMELFDRDFGEPYLHGICTLDELEPARGDPKETIDRVCFVAKKIVEARKIPVFLGGEHSITVGVLNAFKEISDNVNVLKKAVSATSSKERDKGLLVVQFDAHADLRDEFDGTKYSHACVMKRAHETFDTLQIGLRSVSKEESGFMEKNKFDCFFAQDLNSDKDSGKTTIAKKIEKLVQGREVYISVDMDVFDPSVAPGVGTPEPNGLAYRQVLDLVSLIVSASSKTVGFDCVETSPIPGSTVTEYTAAKLVYSMMGFLSAKR